MSDEFFPPDLQYAGEPHGNAHTLVQLGYIFLYITGTLDFIGVPFFIAYIFIFPLMLKAAPGAAGPPLPPFFAAAMGAAYGICTLISLLQGILKMIAATKLRRRSRHAWGWGLAAGIASCMELQCSLFCVLPLAMGIYMIVILCKPHVQNYLCTGTSPA